MNNLISTKKPEVKYMLFDLTQYLEKLYCFSLILIAHTHI